MAVTLRRLGAGGARILGDGGVSGRVGPSVVVFWRFGVRNFGVGLVVVVWEVLVAGACDWSCLGASLVSCGFDVGSSAEVTTP